MSASLRRILAMARRYLYLHRRSLVRLFDIVFWPVMDLLVWGFVSLYIQRNADSAIAASIVFLIGTLIGWDIHYRGQQAVTISLMEEIWTRNIVNVLIAPIRLGEWIAATFLYGMLKITAVTMILSVLAYALYSFNIASIGPAFFLLSASLLAFGWAVGLVTSGILLRFGYAAEALIWGIPFLLQPFSCVFYPVSVLPPWAQVIALCLPTAHVFEAMRGILQDVPVNLQQWGTILGLNLLYFALAIWLFGRMFRKAQVKGHLGRLGQE